MSDPLAGRLRSCRPPAALPPPAGFDAGVQANAGPGPCNCSSGPGPGRSGSGSRGRTAIPCPRPSCPPESRSRPRLRPKDPGSTSRPDRLPLGKQSIALSVQVVGPVVINLNKKAVLRIVVRNTGTADAMDVTVRDQLPENLEFISSQPVQDKHFDSLLIWNLKNVPAGSESSITLNVRATKVGPIDHAATVSMLAGSKARTIIYEAKLKVEQEAPSSVLKGQQVRFKITVSNPGTGVARKVLVRATLSTGLKAIADEANDKNVFELEVGDIESGKHVVLEPLSPIRSPAASSRARCRWIASPTT